MKPMIFINKFGYMMWNYAFNEVMVNGDYPYFRIFFDKQHKQIGMAFCREDDDGAVQIKPFHPKRKVTLYPVVFLFRQAGMNVADFIGAYEVMPYEPDHAIRFYIDLNKNLRGK